MAEIRYDKAKLTDLQGYPGNARRGDVAAIVESLKAHGQYRPIVVQESTGYVLAGNHTMLAAKELGWDELDVGYVDVDDEQARKIVVVDNRTNDLAVYDDQALADLLGDMETLDGSGFDQDEFDSLLATLGPGGFRRGEANKVIDPPDEPVTKLGDVIELGPHRLYCGDSLEFDGVADADMVWTDPPYMVEYQVQRHPSQLYLSRFRQDGKGIEGEKLKGDAADDFAAHAMEAVHRALRPGGVFYVCAPPGQDDLRFRLGLMTAGLEIRQVLIWVKDKFVFGRYDYHYRHETILHGWRDGAAHFFIDDHTQDSVWEIERPKTSKAHPTMKPVELAARCIRNSSTEGDTVFDPFAGSGTVMAAAMQEGRRALMVELDPGYCDVVVERYERLSGQPVVRKGNA